MATCSVEGCETRAKTRGWCMVHYGRFYRTGDPLGMEGRPPKPALSCKVEGCTNKYRCSGYCSIHYNRWRLTGDPGPLERIFYPANLTCSVEDCSKPAKSRGKCNVHARREKRAADRAAGKVTRIAHWASLEDRLRYAGWVEVIRRPELGPCWEWKGKLDKAGYGRANIGQQKTGAAHRAAYQVWNNDGEPLDPKEYVCHRCDNPPCMNPAHLFLGDQHANMGDAKGKKRMANGMRQGRAKLTDQQVDEIRAKYSPRKYTANRLAAEYGVTPSAISMIIRRKNWKTPTNPPIAS